MAVHVHACNKWGQWKHLGHSAIKQNLKIGLHVGKPIIDESFSSYGCEMDPRLMWFQLAIGSMA